MENVVATQAEFSGPTRVTRNLEERLIVRFPGLFRRLSALIYRRLSRDSRLRRALLRRQVVSGWAAVNRRDFELMLVRYAADVTYEFHTGVEELGISGTIRGHREMRDTFGAMREGLTWKVTPALMLDLGASLLVLGHIRVSGPQSGVNLDGEFAQLMTIVNGLVANEQDFRSWQEGLAAAGLDPKAVPVPRPVSS